MTNRTIHIFNMYYIKKINAIVLVSLYVYIQNKEWKGVSNV